MWLVGVSVPFQGKERLDGKGREIRKETIELATVNRYRAAGTRISQVCGRSRRYSRLFSYSYQVPR